MTQPVPHERSLAEETASDQEKPSRIEATVRDVEEKIEKFSKGPVRTLFREKEVTAQYLPSLTELEELPPKDREALLRFIGRTSAALKSGSTAGSKEWLVAFAQECDDVFTRTATKSGTVLLLEKFETFIALHIAAERNSNSYGNPWRYQEEWNNMLIDALETKKDGGAVEALVNPFRFVEEERYYVPAWDKKGNFSLQEKHIGAVIVDGKDSLIDCEGKTLSLFEFNVGFVQEKMLLRDGRNYFGGLPGLPKELADLRHGDNMELHYQLPFGGESLFLSQFLGSNEKTLEEKYGAAFRPYAKELLMLHIRRKDAGHNGEEAEVPYRDIASIRVLP